MNQEGAVLVLSYDLFLRAVKEDAMPEEQPASVMLRNLRITELSRRGSGLLDSPAISGDGAVGDAAAAVSGDDVGGDGSVEEDPVMQAKTPAAQREVGNQAYESHGANTPAAALVSQCQAQ